MEPQTCFICFEPCNAQQICLCTNMVSHQECQLQMMRTNNRIHCAVCNASFSNITYSSRTKLTTTGCAFLAYWLCGTLIGVFLLINYGIFSSWYLLVETIILTTVFIIIGVSIRNDNKMVKVTHDISITSERNVLV